MGKKTIFYICIALIGLSLGMFLYNFFNPDSNLTKPFSFENIKERSSKVYHNVFGGRPDLVSNKIDATAKSGEFFDRNSSLVYKCDSVENGGLNDLCKNPVLIGKLKSENVFEGGKIEGYKWRDGTPVKTMYNVTVPFVNGEKYNGWVHVDEQGIVNTKFSRRENGFITVGRVNVLEDGVVKTVEQAKSLAGYQSSDLLLEGEGWGDFEYGNHNFSDIEVYLIILDEKELNKDHTFYVDGVPYTTVNYGSLDDRQLVLLHFEDWVGHHNWTFNPTVTFKGSDPNPSFKDNWLTNSQPTFEYGGFTSGLTYWATAGSRDIILLYVDVAEFVPASVTILDFIFDFNARMNDPSTAATFVSVLNVLCNWTEGTGGEAGQEGNASWRSGEDGSELSDGTATWTTGDTREDMLKGACYGEDLTVAFGNYGVLNRKFNLTFNGSSGSDFSVVQDWLDDRTNNNGWVMNVSKVHNMGIYVESRENTGKEWQLHVTYEIPPSAPTCTQSDTNITVSEDSGVWELDANMSEAINISCSDADGDALFYTETTETGSGGLFTNPNNDDLIFTTAANATGTRIVTYNVSDGITGDVYVSAQATVTAVDDLPWWDAITNTTSIDMGLGYRYLGINASLYFRDVESDQTPDNITISVNESVADCMMNTVSNFSIFCDPGTLQNNHVIVTLNGSIGVESAINNFEFYAANHTPWWDPIGNTTAANITAFKGKQPVLDNATQYFRDYFDDQTPSSMEIITNETTVSCNVEANFSLFCTPQCITGNYIIILNGTDSDGYIITESFEGSVINTAPTVPNLIFPDNGTETDNETIYLRSSGSTDVEGHTIYYEFYGDMNNLPTTLVANSTSITATWNLILIGGYWWRSRACDVCGLCSDYNDTRFLKVDFENVHVLEDAVTTSQYGTGRYYYEANVTYNNIRFSDVDMILNLSNLTYSLTEDVINSSFSRFYTDISALEYWETLTIPYNWNISLNYINDTSQYDYNTTYGGNIYVDRAELKICNGSDSFPYLNISFKDETTGSSINASVPSSSFIYSVDSGKAITKTYSVSESSENISYSFCVYPWSIANVYTAVIFDYKSEGYPQRKYSADLTLTNSSNNKTLYLLGTADGSYTTFQVVNEADQSLVDVYVVAEKQIGGTWTTTEAKYTDDAGGATFWVDPDLSHKFTFSKSGYTSQTLIITPTQSSYTITMSSVAITPAENYALGISYVIGPSIPVLENGTTYNFNFTINSSYFSLEEAGFVLNNGSGTGIGVASCTTGTGCMASLNADTGSHESFVMNYYWMINNTYMNGSTSWMITRTYIGKASLARLPDDIKRLGQTFDRQADFEFTKSLIAFFLVMVSVLSFCYISGIYSSLAIVGSGFTGVLILDSLDLVPTVGWISVPFLVDHFIVIVVGIIFLGVIIYEFTTR